MKKTAHLEESSKEKLNSRLYQCQLCLRGRRGLAKQLVFQQEVNCGNPVAPGNFLAFLVGAAVIGNRDLINAAAKLCDLHGNLGTECKAIRGERELAYHCGRKDV